LLDPPADLRPPTTEVEQDPLAARLKPILSALTELRVQLGELKALDNSSQRISPEAKLVQQHFTTEIELQEVFEPKKAPLEMDEEDVR
jgi:hypothetical protein